MTDREFWRMSIEVNGVAFAAGSEVWPAHDDAMAVLRSIKHALAWELSEHLEPTFVEERDPMMFSAEMIVNGDPLRYRFKPSLGQIAVGMMRARLALAKAIVDRVEPMAERLTEAAMVGGPVKPPDIPAGPRTPGWLGPHLHVSAKLSPSVDVTP